eukprot:16504-Heterococcus_DN1.PRE.1
MPLPGVAAVAVEKDLSKCPRPKPWRFDKSKPLRYCDKASDGTAELYFSACVMQRCTQSMHYCKQSSIRCSLQRYCGALRSLAHAAIARFMYSIQQLIASLAGYMLLQTQC